MDHVEDTSPQGYVYLSRGLQEQDNHLDQLSNLFEQLQLATVETSDPALDLLTFSEHAFYFAVIMKATPPKAIAKAEGPPKQKKSKRRMKAERRKILRRVPDDEKEKLTTIDLPKYKDTEPASSRLEDPNDPSAANKTDEKRSSSIGGNNSTSALDPEQDLIDLNDDTLGRLHLPPSDTHTTKFEAELKASAVNHALSLQESESPEAIGLVYLVDHSRQPGDCLAHKELNIGIILDPHHRGKGHARQVVELVLEEAFERSACHRVQAILPDHVAKNRALCFFTQMRFAHEGTRRRGFYSAMENVYKDVTYMGILDTDWVVRKIHTGTNRVENVGRPAPQSLWDELILRHQREREDLLAWEDNLDPVGSRSQTPTQSQFEVQLKADGDGAKCDQSSDGSEQTINTVSASGSEENTLVANSDASETDSESMSERSSSPGGYSSSHSSSSSASGWSMVDPSESDFDDSFSVDDNNF